MAWYAWKRYISVAERRRRARKKMEALRKKGVDIQPVEIEGRKIAKTFWGEAWCEHLESFSDFANRLPRGRTYVRNGSVCHLAVTKGTIEAKVSGSTIYNLSVGIKTLPSKTWGAVKRHCAGQIGSLLELLQGNLSDHVMKVVTDHKNGLFPSPGEISFHCDCPDWAAMCKHVAAVLYGVGARFDEKPELLFQLRGVNHEELIATDAEAAVSAATTSGKSKRLDADDLSDVFGIAIDAGNSDESLQGRLKTKPKKKKEPLKRAVKAGPKKRGKKIVKKKVIRKAAKRKAGRKTVVAKKPTQRTVRTSTARKMAKSTMKKRSVTMARQTAK